MMVLDCKTLKMKRKSFKGYENLVIDALSISMDASQCAKDVPQRSL